jgi:hypothetical protein
MFYSETYKTHWWGPPRIASRALMEIPRALGFTDNKDGHSVAVINPEWDVIYPIRNPYSRAVSWWNLRHNDRENIVRNTHISFESFLKKEHNEYFHIQPGHQWDPISSVEKNNIKIKKVIRYENLMDDLLDIDFVKDNFSHLQHELYILKYQSRDSYRKDYIPQAMNPVCSYYTQELADIVWENKKIEFLHGDYQRDSWKYLL